MVSWSTLQSLVIFFGPLVFPKALAFYRSLRAPSTIQPQALSLQSSRALNILFISALVFLASTLPFFSPPNIFQQTQSRLQTPTNVLFARLSALHPLTPSEQHLQTIFEKAGLEARLLYLRFGPSTLICPFVDPQEPDASLLLLLYALPTILAPHLFHLAVLGIVTSSRLADPEAGRWRTLATIAGLVLGFAEFYATASYEHQANARASRLPEIDFFFWKVRVVRGIAVAAVDGMLGWIIWLAATKRAFLQPVSPAEKVETSTKALEGALGKLRGLGAVRNAVFRDTALRSRLEQYWFRDAELVREVFEDREVVAALTDALQQTNVDRLGAEAEGYVESVLGTVRADDQVAQ